MKNEQQNTTNYAKNRNSNLHNSSPKPSLDYSLGYFFNQKLAHKQTKESTTSKTNERRG